MFDKDNPTIEEIRIAWRDVKFARNITIFLACLTLIIATLGLVNYFNFYQTYGETRRFTITEFIYNSTGYLTMHQYNAVDNAYYYLAVTLFFGILGLVFCNNYQFLKILEECTKEELAENEKIQ